MPLSILLISVPIRLRQKPYWYIGVAQIAAAAEAAGHRVQVLDLNMLRPKREDIPRLLKRYEFDVAAISAMVTCFPIVREIATELKRINRRAPIVLGGTLASTSYDLVLPNSEVDIAVLGEGEVTFVELLRELEGNGNIAAVNGIAYIDDGIINVTDARARVTNLDEVPFPAYHLFDFPTFLKTFTFPGVPDRKTVPMISGRGCPYGCLFCFKTFERKVTYRSPENILEEIEYLYHKYGVRGVLFVDDLFVINKERVLEFCEKLTASKMRLKWGCLGRAGVVDEGVIEALRTSGCVWIGYGFESGSQKMLDAMKKGITVGQAEEAVRLTRKYGMICSPTFMIGIPGETRETVMETVEFFKRTDLSPTRLFIANPYPGTELYDKAIKEGLIPDKLKFLNEIGDATDMSLNITGMSDEELIGLRREAELLIHRGYYKRHPIENIIHNNSIVRFIEVAREQNITAAVRRVFGKILPDSNR
ncbi:MAG: radical SAM protein [bacterium]|nr:radical SAM protein [bacterium]